MKRGGTLIEVMMACLVLMAIALAGGAYVSQALGTLALHRDRSLATARATSWMEELKAGGYRSLTQQIGNATFKNLVTNNAFARLEYWTVPELGMAGTGREAVKISVQVTNRAPDFVRVTTIYAQDWRMP